MARTAEEWQRVLESRVLARRYQERIERGCELCGEEFPLVNGHREFAEVVLAYDVRVLRDGGAYTLAKGTVVFCHHEPCAMDHEIA